MSLTLSQFARVELHPYGLNASTLNVSGDITFSDGSQMILNSINPNDRMVLNARDLALDGDGSSFTSMLNNAGTQNLAINLSRDIKLSPDKSALFRITANSKSVINLNCRDISLANSVDYSNSFDIEINAADTVFNLSAGQITVGTINDLYLKINASASTSLANISFSKLTTNVDGVFDARCSVLSSTMALSLSGNLSPGSIMNNGTIRIIGANPSGNQKPDPESMRRNISLTGIYNDSYISCSGYTDFENASITRFGKWRTLDKYGICFFGIDGAADQKFFIYNCDISSSADTGIYLSGCTRLNRQWYDQGISSCIIRGNAYNGIWFYSTTKSEIRNCKVYNNAGGNVGYGVHLTNGSNENTIQTNDVYGNKIIGVYLQDSNKNLIYSNLVHDQRAGSGQEGIYLFNSNKNIVAANSCYVNPVHGIAMEYGSNFNYIVGNKCSKNLDGGLRIRYNANGNMFIANISSENARAGFTTHSSIDTLCANELFQNNTAGDIYIEGEESGGYISQLWLKNCLFRSTVTFTNTPEKQEFTKADSWVISQKHNGTNGLTRVWGQFAMPQTAHSWHTSDMLKFDYADKLFSGKSHGWNETVNDFDTPMLRYDDGGADGAGMPPSGSNDITSITTSSTTRTELWLVTFESSLNRWTVWGSVSGTQTRGGSEGTGMAKPDSDYVSDNGEVRFRITHNYSPVSPGEQYVFVTLADSNDQNTQKELGLCDFSDPNYIGASFVNNSGGTAEFIGLSTAPTIVTRKLAEDIPDTGFYYSLTLGGTINKIKYTNFSYMDGKGLLLVSKPSANTENIRIENILPGTTYSTYISALNVTDHYLDSVYIETSSVSGIYNVRADGSILYFRDYTRPFLPDKLSIGNAAVYWDPNLVWSGLSGFSNVGAVPGNAEQSTAREFQVKYIDRGLAANGNAPTTVQVWIDFNDNGTYDISERIGMKLKPGAGNDGIYSDGEIYYSIISSVAYAGDGIIPFRFFASNQNSMTISTYSYSLYSVFNNVTSTNEATGIGTTLSTFTIRGTPPRITIVTPSTKQSGIVPITFNLIDDDNKSAPYNYCDITVEYNDPVTSTWKTATMGVGSEPVDDLPSSTTPGTQHVFVWDSAIDLPNKDASTKIRIIPTDEDGTGAGSTTGSFQLDNIIASRLVFISLEQELRAGATSQAVTIQAQDSAGNKDIDANIQIGLMSTSTNYAFVSSTANVTITSVTMVSGEATFKYRDEQRGNPSISIACTALQSASQNWWITTNVSALVSNLSIIVLDSVVGSSLVPVNVTVTLKDLDGNPIASKDVTIFVSGSDNYITQPDGTTNSSGQAFASFWSTKAERKTVTATDITDNITIVSSASVNFMPGAVDPGNSTISISTPIALIGSTVPVNVTLLDKYGNPVSNKLVVVSILPNVPGDLLVLTTNYTGNLGSVAAATLYCPTAGQRIISAQDQTDLLTLNSSFTVTFLSLNTIDTSSPSINSVTPSAGAVLTTSFSQVVITASDTISGLNFSSSTITLTNPDGSAAAGTISTSGSNTLTFTITGSIQNGAYSISVRIYDNANNYTDSNTIFTINVQDPEQVFKTQSYSYPNPSTNGIVRINYSLLNNADKVTLRVYNIAGELVREEKGLDTTVGANKVYVWDSRNQNGDSVGTGVYIIKLIAEMPQAAKYVTTKKQIVIKR